MNFDPNQTRQRIQHLFFVLIFSYAVMILGLLWWGVWQGDSLLAREDNPRLVEAELRIQRGRIVDTNNVVLAQNGGTTARQTREYLIKEVEPVIGYYSLRYGTAGVEESLDTILRGDIEDEQEEIRRTLLHEPQIGQNVRLSLDISLQTAVIESMGDETGAAVVLFLPRGGDEQVALIRAMASLPTYDPNQLNDNFEQLVADESGPLLNRATQSQYQPGAITLPFLLALEPELLNTLSADSTAAEIEQQAAELATLWSNEDILHAWDVWGFNSAPAFSLPVTDVTPPNAADITSIERAISGESTLLITPLQLALATSALIRDGVLPQPRLVTAVQNEEGWVNYSLNITPTTPIVSADIATTVQQTLWQPLDSDELDYSIYTASVPAGENRFNHWLVGMTPAQAPRYVIIFVYENEQQSTTWEQIEHTIRQLKDS